MGVLYDKFEFAQKKIQNLAKYLKSFPRFTIYRTNICFSVILIDRKCRVLVIAKEINCDGRK